jgi:hypothetical protein
MPTYIKISQLPSGQAISSAFGTITLDTAIIGSITPEPVTSSLFTGAGTGLTGTAASLTSGKATVLATARAINGVNFDGSAPITVTAAASTLTGTVLNSTVVTSSLTAVGTINTGVWNGSTMTGTYGGTGVNNGSNTITIGGNIKFGGSYSNAVTIITSSSNAITVNLATSNVFKHTFTENTTFTFSNPTATGTECEFDLWLFQGGTPYTPTWPGSVRWSNATPPVVNNASSNYLITFSTIDGGTNWVGILAAEAYA